MGKTKNKSESTLDERRTIKLDVGAWEALRRKVAKAAYHFAAAWDCEREIENMLVLEVREDHFEDLAVSLNLPASMDQALKLVTDETLARLFDMWGVVGEKIDLPPSRPMPALFCAGRDKAMDDAAWERLQVKVGRCECEVRKGDKGYRCPISCWMLMHHNSPQVAAFKHRETREYMYV